MRSKNKKWKDILNDDGESSKGRTCVDCRKFPCKTPVYSLRKGRKFMASLLPPEGCQSYEKLFYRL